MLGYAVGTQPAQPSLACYESATFDTGLTCAWHVTGTQPVQPSLACYESATFDTITCAWVVTWEHSLYNQHLLVMSQRHLTQ